MVRLAGVLQAEGTLGHPELPFPPGTALCEGSLQNSAFLTIPSAVSLRGLSISVSFS